MYIKEIKNDRIRETEADSMFTDRWSPRSFHNTELTEFQIKSLFEAVRWSPSCFNEQPWSIVYSVEEKGLEKLRSTLVDKNRKWADNAPLLLYFISKKHYEFTGEKNPYVRFDTGAAWMSLSLQARKLGLYAHAMAEFNKEKAYEVIKTDKDKYDIVCAVAVGYRDKPDNLPEDFRKMEKPNTRKPLSEIAINLEEETNN